MNTEVPAVLATYRLAMLLPPGGLSEEQLEWTKLQFMFLVRACPGIKIYLYIQGFSSRRVENYGLPRQIWNRQWPAGVHMEMMPMLAQQSDAISLCVFYRFADEVWCFPAGLGSQATNRSLAAKVLRSGVSMESRPSRYKWIPPWVEVETAGKNNVRPKSQS